MRNAKYIPIYLKRNFEKKVHLMKKETFLKKVEKIVR